MKKIFYYSLLFLCSSVAFLACEDNVNEDPAEEKLETTAQAEALVNAVYGPLQTLSSSYSFLVESATETTISFEEKDETKDGPQVSVFETEASNWYPIKVFNRLYTSIGAANLAIEKINNAVINENLQQASKDLLIARAKFIRGYDYFQLVQLFGEVPLILSTSDENKVRNSIDQIYAQIVEDLTASIEKLPAFSATKSVPSQGAANAILAKAYLTWGQKPLSQAEVDAIKTAKTDPDKPAVDADKLNKAVEYANKVINSGGYSLNSNFNNIWGVGFENNVEVIFSISHNGDGIDAQGNHQTHCGFTWPKEERTDPHISYADISFENKLGDNDTRKLLSYATSVEYVDGNKDTLTWPLSIVRPGKWIHRADVTSTSRIVSVDVQPNNIDHIDFRYAEVLLVKAEALHFLNKSVEALPLINQLRTRAGIENLTALTTETLYQEWQNEFAFEQKHWLNLVRWRTLIKSVLDNVPNYEYYKAAYNDEAQFKTLPDADASRFAFYKRVYKHLHAKVDHINGHFYRFPIPLSENYTDLGITPQNPGY